MFDFVSALYGMSFKAFLLNIAYNALLYKTVAVSAIIGGQPAAEQYPFFVTVYRENQLRGGTISIEDVVVTAAHCLYDSHKHRWAYSKEIEILHGDYTRANEWILTIYPCVDYKPHHEFESVKYGRRNSYDVAVVKLGRPIENYDYQKQRSDLVPKATTTVAANFDSELPLV